MKLNKTISIEYNIYRNKVYDYPLKTYNILTHSHPSQDIFTFLAGRVK